MSFANIMLAIFILLQVFDYISTVKILSAGGEEKMPLTKMFITIFGLKLGVAISKLTAVICGIAVWLVSDSADIILSIINILYISILYTFNYRSLKKIVDS